MADVSGLLYHGQASSGNVLYRADPVLSAPPGLGPLVLSPVLDGSDQYNDTIDRHLSPPAALVHDGLRRFVEVGGAQKPAPSPWSYVAGAAGCGGAVVRSLWCLSCACRLEVPVTCGDRTCVDCRRREAGRLRRVYWPLLRQVDPGRLAMVTLTVRLEPGADLSSLMAAMRNAWSRLIRRRVWRRAVRGALEVFEVRWSPYGGGSWNVHVHALVEAGLLVVPYKYRTGRGRRRRQKVGAEIVGPAGKLTWQDLKEAWRQVSPGASYIVDITPVRKLPGAGGPLGALTYLLKYLTKAQEWPSGPAGVEARRQYNLAMRLPGQQKEDGTWTRGGGRRTVSVSGQWNRTHKQYRFVRVLRVKAPCRSCGIPAGWMVDWELRRLRRMAYELGPPRAPPVAVAEGVGRGQALRPVPAASGSWLPAVACGSL